jgi:AcrR family transcriptional regulator
MAGTRERIIGATAELFRKHGYTGTGLKEVCCVSGAPLGSVYHFFPGGKEQLAGETLRVAGEHYRQVFRDIMDAAPNVMKGLDNFFAWAAKKLRDTDYANACPIATVALEVAGTNESLRQVTAEIFESWIDGIAAHLHASGVPKPAARELSVLTLSALEGAFILCRAMKSTKPMKIIGRTVVDAVQKALPKA